MNTVQKALREACRAQGFRPVAEAVGVSTDFLYKVIGGSKQPSPKVLTYLGFERLWLYRRIKPQSPAPTTAEP